MTETCGIFLITKNWKTLIGKASRNGAHQQYSIPKGQAEAGEDFLTSALRELYEEANVTINPENHQIHKLSPIRYTKKAKILNAFFIVGLDENDFQDLKCNSFTPKGQPELRDLEWRSIRESKTLLHPTQAQALEQIEEFLLEHRL